MIYVTGDTHGDRSRLSKKRLKALNPGDTLIICGDFGFLWNDDRAEQKFLYNLSKRPYNICFADGTHENFDLLYRFPVKEKFGGRVHAVADNIFHLIRGEIYAIEDKKIFVMGGGQNPDRDPDEELYEELPHFEIPDKADLLSAVENLEKVNYKVDYIITHEPSAKIMDFLLLSENGISGTTALRAYFDELSTQATYDKWFFGSMHIDKYISPSVIAVFNSIINAETGKRI